VAWLIALLVPSAASLQAGQQPGSHVRIFAAGGLSGQLDGMPEFPAGSFDKFDKENEVVADIRPYGGLEGLIQFKNRLTTPADLVLITGNNLPRNVMRKGEAGVEPFFARLRELHASAIGVGPDDFLRGLDNKTAVDVPSIGRARETGRPAIVSSDTVASLFVEWLQQPTTSPADRLPFLLSNAAVRLHRPGLNTVSSSGFILAADANASVSWIKDASVDFPCRHRDAIGQAKATITRKKDGTAEGIESVSVKPDAKNCRAKLSWPSVLAPSSVYEIEIQLNGVGPIKFELYTDKALTNELAYVPKRPEQPIVVSLVDPHVRQILGDKKWRWSKEPSGPGASGAAPSSKGPSSKGSAQVGAPCEQDECEIVILKPAEALDAVLALAEPKSSQRPVVLMSQLSDKDTSALLQRNQRLRFVILPPDSQAVGRAAPKVPSRSGGGPQYSGDLGYGAILNSDTPEVTQVWIRPEWFAESAHEIEADVTPGTWKISNVKLQSTSVRGLALCSRPVAHTDERSPAVQYFLQDWSVDGKGATTTHPGAAVATAPDLYAIAPQLAWDRDGRFKQGTPAPWRDVNTFAAIALDSMRSYFDSDLAVLPTDAIDEGWVAYLRDDPRAVPQVSRVLLERVLFRAGTIVNVRLSDADVVDAIGKIGKAGAPGVGYCIAGLGNAGCDASGIKAKDAMINGRRRNSSRFYTVAMPESVALENGLTILNGKQSDLVAIMDKVLARSEESAVDTCSADYRRDSGKTSASDSQPAPDRSSGKPAAADKKRPETLPEQIEKARADANNPYVIIKPADVSFNATRITEPPGGAGLLNKLTIPGNGAKNSYKINASLSVDGGLIDKPRWALRSVDKLLFGRNRVNGQETVDPNESTVSLRFDWKVPRGRIFGGVFWESQFVNQSADVTPKGKSSPRLTLVTLRRDYKYIGGGYESEVAQYGKWFSVDPLRFTAGIGNSAHEHTDIAINGDRLGLDNLVKKGGPAGLLDDYFKTHPNLTSDGVFAFVDESLTRSRVQIEATPKVKVPLKNAFVTLGSDRSMEVSFETTYRLFVGPNQTPLAEKQSAQMKLKLSIPLLRQTAFTLGATGLVSQVNGIKGVYIVWQPAVGISIPIVGSRRAGWVW
jgi:hypothetical protein